VYEEGQGVPQDYAQAAIWYRKAADRGTSQRITISAWHTITGWACRKTMWSSQVVPEGCRSGLRRRANRLGARYAQGIPQDYVQAHMWFNLAALHARCKRG
jgi:uncharacterized protein